MHNMLWLLLGGCTDADSILRHSIKTEQEWFGDQVSVD
jgi:hypothetical protein